MTIHWRVTPPPPPALLWTTWLRCRNGTGTYVRCTAAAFPLLLCERAAVARPAAAAVRPGGNREWNCDQKCSIVQATPGLRRNPGPPIYAAITQKLRSFYAEITQFLRSNYADLRSHYAIITQSLRNHYAKFTQFNYAALRNSLRNCFTQLLYAIALRNCFTQLFYAIVLRNCFTHFYAWA